MTEKKRDPGTENPFYEAEQVASIAECTGLMPSLPQDENQNISYAALYAIHKGEERDEEMYRKR